MCLRWTDLVLKEAPQISQRKDRSEEWTAWCSAATHHQLDFFVNMVRTDSNSVTFQMSFGTAEFTAESALKLDDLAVGSGGRMKKTVLL